MPAMTNEYIIPGPALLAATAVSTKMPVPITAPMPSMVNSKAPSWRVRDRLPAVSRIRSSDFLRVNSITFSPGDGRPPCEPQVQSAADLTVHAGRTQAPWRNVWQGRSAPQGAVRDDGFAGR